MRITIDEIVTSGMRAYGEHDGVSIMEQANCRTFMELLFEEARMHQVDDADIQLLIEALSQPEMTLSGINLAAMVVAYLSGGESVAQG